ncbi:hypothetical protein FOCG_13898 [Fusarium oxysporum f. sp. radicis-lycopersici 26381]|nr:hypothetical protein FOCG_13898 [Fusarium oxysporum f. sp. radicis-lycopersici 26381]
MSVDFLIFHFLIRGDAKFVFIILGSATRRLNIDGNQKTGFVLFSCLRVSSSQQRPCRLQVSSRLSVSTVSPSTTNLNLQHPLTSGRSESECRSGWDGNVLDRLHSAAQHDKGWRAYLERK